MKRLELFVQVEPAPATITSPVEPGWVDLATGQFVFYLRADEADFDYSAVIAELWDGDQRVGCRLLPVDLTREGTHYRNSAPLAGLLGEREYARTMTLEFLTDKEEILKRTSKTDVERELDSSYVGRRPEVAAKLRLLERDLPKKS